MLAQSSLPLPLHRPQRPRTRSVRRPFHPSQDEGPYRLPHAVRDRLASSLAPFRNRETIFALAVFIARYHSAPGRVVEPFPLDRRALAEIPDLDLTEGQIRSAIRVLEDIDFLARTVTSGSRYQPTEDGLRKKPIRFQFGREYFDLFDAANERAAAARGRDPHARRPIPAETMRSPPVTAPEGSRANYPKVIHAVDPSISLGNIRTEEKSPFPSQFTEQSHIAMGSKGIPPGSLSEGEGMMDRPSHRSSAQNRRPPKNDREVVTSHLDETERQNNDTRLVEIRDKAFAARRAADALNGKASEEGYSPASERPIPSTTAPDDSSASSNRIEDRDGAAQGRDLPGEGCSSASERPIPPMDALGRPVQTPKSADRDREEAQARLNAWKIKPIELGTLSDAAKKFRSGS